MQQTQLNEQVDNNANLFLNFSNENNNKLGFRF